MRKRQVVFVRAEEVIQAVAELCRHFSAVEVILFGSRAKGTARERSDIDVAVSGVKDFDALAEQIEELPTLYSIDLVNMDTCKNQLLLAWKVMKDILVEYYAMTGFIAGSPREVLKTSYKAELISDDTWIEMLKGGRLKPFYHISIPVDQKLRKVPLDIRGVTEIRLGAV